MILTGFPLHAPDASWVGLAGAAYSGAARNYSAACHIDSVVGAGSWSVIAEGAAPHDGITAYKAQVGNPPQTRWGNYSAAAVDGNSIWIGSEYIAHACSYMDWGGPFFTGGAGDNLFGTCAGANHSPGLRTALLNWSTRISELIP